MKINSKLIILLILSFLLSCAEQKENNTQRFDILVSISKCKGNSGLTIDELGQKIIPNAYDGTYNQFSVFIASEDMHEKLIYALKTDFSNNKCICSNAHKLEQFTSTSYAEEQESSVKIDSFLRLKDNYLLTRYLPSILTMCN